MPVSTLSFFDAAQRLLDGYTGLFKKDQLPFDDSPNTMSPLLSPPISESFANEQKQTKKLRVSPFFKIPLELRNKIYADVVVSEEPVHITNKSSCGWDQLFFVICPVALRDFSGRCDCYSQMDTGGGQTLDTSLLSVAQQLRKGVMNIFFARNHIHFDS